MTELREGCEQNRAPLRSVFPALCLLVAWSAGFAGCAAFRPLDERGEAIRHYRYQGQRDELIVEPPKLSTTAAKPGELLTREVTFALLSPQRERKFPVTETVTLTGPSLVVELSKQESEKPQGSHISTIQLTVPKDLPPGVYVLITRIGTEEQQVTRKTPFQVLK
jgi:hypothetical protein